ncbi:MAG: SIMPL domain-containing protein [Chloroflexi bacterium]|nr:SIMPL domain-containing protein [Chloroflexota bacterium]
MGSWLFPRGTLAAVVAAVLLWGTSAPPKALSGEAAVDGPSKTMTVAGHGQITLTPDIARSSFGVETTGRSAQETLDANAALMNQVIGRLKGLGVEEKDIRTTGIGLFPIRPPRPTPPRDGEPTPLPAIQGYRATNNVQVTLRDLGQVGNVIDAAVQAGANMVSGVSFGLEDVSAAQRSALAAAAANARSKADTLAGSLGLAITGIQSVSEGGFGGPAPLPFARGGPASEATPVEPGQLTVSANVTVSFTIQ